jgi:hypothetical protein
MDTVKRKLTYLNEMDTVRYNKENILLGVNENSQKEKIELNAKYSDLLLKLYTLAGLCPVITENQALDSKGFLYGIAEEEQSLCFKDILKMENSPVKISLFNPQSGDTLKSIIHRKLEDKSFVFSATPILNGRPPKERIERINDSFTRSSNNYIAGLHNLTEYFNGVDIKTFHCAVSAKFTLSDYNTSLFNYYKERNFDTEESRVFKKMMQDFEDKKYNFNNRSEIYSWLKNYYIENHSNESEKYCINLRERVDIFYNAVLSESNTGSVKRVLFEQKNLPEDISSTFKNITSLQEENINVVNTFLGVKSDKPNINTINFLSEKITWKFVRDAENKIRSQISDITDMSYEIRLKTLAECFKDIDLSELDIKKRNSVVFVLISIFMPSIISKFTGFIKLGISERLETKITEKIQGFFDVLIDSCNSKLDDFLYGSLVGILGKFSRKQTEINFIEDLFKALYEQEGTDMKDLVYA